MIIFNSELANHKVSISGKDTKMRILIYESKRHLKDVTVDYFRKQNY